MTASQIQRLFRPAIAIALLSATLSACTPLQTLSTISDNGAYRRIAGLAFGPGERDRLDLYLPQAIAEDTPLVVFFYGGGWRRGDKADYEFVGAALAEAGFPVAVPDYRVWPEVRFPAFVEDGARALAWLGRKSPEFGIEGERVFLMGHSAGAHLAALLALDPSYRAAAGAGTREIVGWVGLSGPYDFLPLDEGSYLQEVFPAATREASQPINHVGPGAPPTLLIHGQDDRVVEPGNSRRLAKALSDAGADVTLRIFEDRGHAAIAAALAPPLDFIAETRPETIDFLRRIEAGAAPP